MLQTFGGLLRGTVRLFRYLDTLLRYLADHIADLFRFSIRLRLMLSYAVSTALILLVVSVVVFRFFVKTVTPEIADRYSPAMIGILSTGFWMGLVLSLVFGSRAGKRFVAPIEKMNQTIREISVSDLSSRIEVSGVKNELKDLAIAFNQMLDAIEHSVAKQNQFVSDASHELRTPISVIKGYADLLDRWGKSDEQVRDEAIAAIKQESEQMRQLIEQLLFLARGDRKKQQIHREEVLVSELLEEIWKETKMIDKEHEIILERNEANYIYADRGMIKEAIRIFVENSIKYTPPQGQITVAGYLHRGNVEILIKDTGIGVRKEEIRKIFDRFYRADQSRNKKSGGTGLGLSIAKWIIDVHGGKIYAKSEVGVGSEFRILLALRAAAENAEGENPSISSK